MFLIKGFSHNDYSIVKTSLEMKKGFLIISIILLANSIIFSQEQSSGTIEIIPNIGYTASSVIGENSPQTDDRLSYQVGIIGDYYFNGRWSIRTGISKYNMGAESYGSKLNLSYLNIPIAANWHFGKTRKWNLNFGLSSGLLLSGDVDGRDVKNDYRSFQFGLNYGIGYKIRITENIRILIDHKGVIGLTPILKSNSPIWLNVSSGYNLGWVFLF